jgi:hypothetical protein
MKLLFILLSVDVHLCAAACHQVPVENATGRHTACSPDDGVVSQGKLVVYFCGSGAAPPGPRQAFLNHSVALGFHFFGVLYDDSPAVGGFCDPNSPDHDCYEKIRLVRLFGGSYRNINIEKADGGLVRFARAMAWLASTHTADGWAQFVDSKGEFIASKIIVAGESQGSGMAIMTSRYYSVDRVLQFAGVDDMYNNSGVPTAAPWVSQKGWKTSADKIYGLGNTNGFACLSWHTTWPAAGMVGSLVNVDGTTAPYAGGRMLCSSKLEPGHGKAPSPGAAHGAPVSDDSYAPAWTYMLTGTTDFDEVAAENAGSCDCSSAPAPAPRPPQPANPQCCWSKWGDKDSCGNYPSGASGARCNADTNKTCSSDADCKISSFVV